MQAFVHNAVVILLCKYIFIIKKQYTGFPLHNCVFTIM